MKVELATELFCGKEEATKPRKLSRRGRGKEGGQRVSGLVLLTQVHGN